jgi:glycosyltransferase involved in cell wall biosynthesis
MISADNPVVSVCVPTYQGAAFLPAAIDSVLAQSYPHFEIWILDDNSPDDTQGVVARYSDPRIRYRRNLHNLGPEGNWNRCLDVAQAKYFKLLPHDDLLEPDCLRQQVSVLEADTANDIVLVFGSRRIIDPLGRTFFTRGLPRTRAGRIDGLALVKRCIRAGTNLIGEPGNVLFRREMIKKVGRYDATFPYVIDLDYWIRMLLHGDAYYTATRTSAFRVSEGSWSVAIGGKQYREFKGLVDKLSADARFGISSQDRLLGYVKARLHTWGRALAYRFLFTG